MLYIKYLVHGTFPVEAPEGWHHMSDSEQISFMRNALGNATDVELVDGMRTTPKDSKELWEDKIEPQAVNDTDAEELEYSFATTVWLAWAFGEEEHSFRKMVLKEEEEDCTIICMIFKPIKSLWNWMVNLVK